MTTGLSNPEPAGRRYRIVSVVGARPNFMKIAPMYQELRRYPQIEHRICHTGQHYDEKMSKVFFEDLELPQPDYYLGIGSGTMTEQMANIMIAFEKVVLEFRPDLVVVVGDVTSTIACSIVAQRYQIPKAHIEAGLRSGDRTMPEEINRILTDAISDLLFTTERGAQELLDREGVPADRIHFVGNTMIDSLVRYLPKADRSDVLKETGVVPQQYTVVTLHRPRNVDSESELRKIIALLNDLSHHTTIVFPVHPRTRKNLASLGLISGLSERIIVTEPVGYIEFLALMKHAALVITDSGGIQEETTYLGIQCLTARDNTERPVTVTTGTNTLIGTDWNTVGAAARRILAGERKHGTVPELWDGKAAERIAQIMARYLSARVQQTAAATSNH